MDMFSVLLGVWLIPMYIFVKIDQSIHLGYVHSLCVSYSSVFLKSKEVMPGKSNLIAKYHKARNHVESLSLPHLPGPSEECEADREDTPDCFLECLLSGRREIIEIIDRP